MIEVNNLSKQFPDKKLFEHVSLSFTIGNTYGIIGANGAGKSTFLKMIAGEIEPSSGTINIAPKKRISTLGQDHNKFNDITATEVVIMGNKELYKMQQEKDAIYANPDATNEDYEKAGHLEEEYDNAGGWNAENDAQILLSGLEVDKAKWDLPMSELKANEKVKVLLAQALFGAPDILVLDEPTNHLDLRAIKWLEDFLADYENLVLVVSHDSDFLDQVCTHIVDIDFGGAKMFTGNYSFWKQSSELLRELQQKQNAKKEDQIKQLKAFVARFAANASKSSQATSRKKALEKIELDEIKPSNRKYPYIRWELNRNVGKDILKVENLTYKNPDTGEVLFSNLSFTLSPKEKMVVIGPDDLAKTKLLEILAGEAKPSSGTVKWGSTIKTDFFPNDNSKYFNKSESIMEWISKWPLENELDENKDNADSKMRNFLGRMLFSGDSALKDVSKTSGGEKARLMFSRMMLKESNFLILDQPLDHLDTESIDSVIEGIKEYKSSVIFTTYNRALIKRGSNVILEIRPDASFVFRGTLEEYDEKMGNK